MGLYFRKSFRVGLLRVNLSKFGIGLSTGIPGLRVGTGPRGNYIRMGAGGVYYQKTISTKKQKAIPNSTPIKSDKEQQIYADHGIVLNPVESGSVLRMVDADAASVLAELNGNSKKMSIAKLLTVACVIAFITGICLVEKQQAPLAGQLLSVSSGVLFIPALIVGLVADARRKRTVMAYDLDEEIEGHWNMLVETLLRAGRCSSVKNLDASGQIFGGQRKYHGGAGKLLDTKEIKIKLDRPKGVKTNVDPVCIPAGNETLYVFPDRFLVQSPLGYGAVNFNNLQLRSDTSPTIMERAPRDGKVVGQTWKFVNKDGGPDRRFNNNCQLPIVEYSALEMKSSSGLNEEFYFSVSGIAEIICREVENFRALLKRKSETAPVEIVEVKPVAKPKEKLAEKPQSAVVEMASVQNAPSTQRTIIYLCIGGATYGPYDSSTIQSWITTNPVTENVFFWTPDANDWKPIAEFAEK